MEQKEKPEPQGEVAVCWWRQYMPKNFEQVLDGVQRVTCMGGAIWYLVTTREWMGFLIILAAGEMDIRKAKAVLVKALQSALH